MSVLKNSLTIRLTEPVVYLKDVDFTGRRRTHNEDSPPSMLRGLLILNLVKPTRISSIEIELQAKSASIWPEEGAGGRKIDIMEEHKVFSAETVYFRAGTSPMSRRAVSADPGLRHYQEEREEDESTAESDIEHEDDESLRRSHGIHGRRVSADYSTFQRDHVSHQESNQVPSPPYSPALGSPALSPTSSISNLRSATAIASVPSTPVSNQISQTQTCSRYSTLPSRAKHEDSPGQVLEVFRNALKNDLNMTSEGSSASSDNLQRGRSQLSTTQASPTANTQSKIHTSPDNRRHSRDNGSASSVKSFATEDRGRHNKRFSLTAVSNAFLDRMRSNSPLATRPGEKDDSGRGRSKEKDKAKEGRPALVRVSEVLGLDGDDGKEYGDGWKEFKKGTYTYPISFAIPANSPPSLQLDFGSIVWRLKATAHRPGTFTTKLTASREVTVIATPSDDALEDTENIVVERTWDEQMQYMLVVSGRTFPIGGRIPVQMTFMPFAKIKIHRISIILEEKAVYYTQMNRLAKTSTPTRLVLVSIKHPEKTNRAILPLPEEVNAFKKSPFYSVLVNEAEIGLEDDRSNFRLLTSQLASNLTGPGPWALQFDAKIPASCSHLHPTNQNKSSNIIVNHVLKIVYRVERGDDVHVDANGKRKLFDIVIHSPIHILSCLCNLEHTSLPRYSESWNGTPLESFVCGCQNNAKGKARANVSQSVPDSAGLLLRPVESMSSAAENPVSIAGTSTMQSGRYYQDSSTQLAANTQFERLITGQESEIGEAPPPYQSRA